MLLFIKWIKWKFYKNILFTLDPKDLQLPLQGEMHIQTVGLLVHKPSL